jgi:two-component system chemotaxis response regulator CheY
MHAGVKGAGRTVMIVDDSRLSREMLREILEKEGYSIVAEAIDGNDAVEKYLETRPQVTVMDLMMPNKNGVYATREIKGIDEGAKVLMCSSVELQSLTIAAVNAGALGVIFKPLVPAQVLEALDAVFLWEQQEHSSVIS